MSASYLCWCVRVLRRIIRIAVRIMCIRRTVVCGCVLLLFVIFVFVLSCLWFVFAEVLVVVFVVFVLLCGVMWRRCCVRSVVLCCVFCLLCLSCYVSYMCMSWCYSVCVCVCVC